MYILFDQWIYIMVPKSFSALFLNCSLGFLDATSVQQSLLAIKSFGFLVALDSETRHLISVKLILKISTISNYFLVSLYSLLNSCSVS